MCYYSSYNPKMQIESILAEGGVCVRELWNKLSEKYEIGSDMSILSNVPYPRACLLTGKYLLHFTST